MTRVTTRPYSTLRKTLPRSRMVYPRPVRHKIKYFFWRVYTPLHPRVRDTALRLGIVSAQAKAERWGSRQKFLVGTIAPGHTLESVVAHLLAQGFGNHFVAWEDEGEVVSLRYVENFVYQYHIRIFEDGEIRAHYEYTPECHPIRHYYAVGFEPRRQEFLRILGDTITPAS